MSGRIEFLVVVLPVMLLAACGGGGGGGGPIHPLPPPDGNGTPPLPPPPSKDYTWTVMYYVAADNNLAVPSINEALQHVELDNYSDEVAVFLQARTYEGDCPIPFVEGGFKLLLVWDSNVDIDLYVLDAAREDMSEDDLSVASPWLGASSQDGYLSADSVDSGYSYEGYTAYPRVHDGYYVVIADYYSDGWGVIGWHWHGDVTLIVRDQNDTEIWRSEPVYMDIETPYDQYLEGYGVHAFGALYWNDSRWVFETPDKLPASAKSVVRLERPGAKPGLPPRTTEASASH